MTDPTYRVVLLHKKGLLRVKTPLASFQTLDDALDYTAPDSRGIYIVQKWSAVWWDHLWRTNGVYAPVVHPEILGGYLRDLYLGYGRMQTRWGVYVYDLDAGAVLSAPSSGPRIAYPGTSVWIPLAWASTGVVGSYKITHDKWAPLVPANSMITLTKGAGGVLQGTVGD